MQRAFAAPEELHSAPRMALLPGTRLLGACGAPVAALAHSSRPQRQAAPRATLRSRARQSGCASGPLSGLPLPKVSRPIAHKQRTKLPAHQACAVSGEAAVHTSRGPPVAAQAGAGGCCAARRRQRGAWQVVRAEADFYDVLGVPRNADKKAIKSAYRCVLLVATAQCRTTLVLRWTQCSSGQRCICAAGKRRASFIRM